MELSEQINDFVPAGVKKFSEQLAKGLGIFGAVFSGISSFSKPTPDQIIDACNKAIKQLTDEVNAQFANMEGLIDQKILEEHKRNMENFLKYFGTTFVNCIEEPIEADFMECLKESERKIHAASSFFMG